MREKHGRIARRVLAINAFTPRDSEFGVGEALSERTFSYRGTLFRFFEEAELRDLLADWNIVHFENVSWNDPPHGTFRPYAHTHDNWYVVGTPR